MSEDVFLGGGELTAASAWSNGLPGPSTIAILPAGESPLVLTGPFQASVVSVASGASYTVDSEPNTTPDLQIGTLDLASGSEFYANRASFIAQTVEVANGATFKMYGYPANVLGVTQGGNASVLDSQLGAAAAWSVAHGYPSVPLSAIIGDLQIAPGGNVELNGTVAVNGVAYPDTVPAGNYQQFFPAPASADTLQWSAGNPPNPNDATAGATTTPPNSIYPEFTVSSNWSDLSEGGLPSATPPGPGNTLVFTPGTHDVYGPDFFVGDRGGATVGNVTLDAGAHVTFWADVRGAIVPPALNMQSITLESGATLSIGGLTAATVDLQPGAVLDLTGPSGSPQYNAEDGIGTLTNDGGTLDLPTWPDMVAGTLAPLSIPPDQPYLVQENNYFDFPQGSAHTTGEFAPGETLLPAPGTLEINLGTFTQGATVAPLYVGLSDLGNTDTVMSMTMLGTAGEGYAVAIGQPIPISPTVAAITVNTSAAGQQVLAAKFATTFQTRDFYDSDGQPSVQSGAPQVLILTDNIVAPTGAANPGGGPAVPCFVRGTWIATLDGWTPVDRLRPGDRVRTTSGHDAAIRWIGRHTVQVRDAGPPVCLRVGAIAPGIPCRDLWLSPDHGVFIDGGLIPVHRLVNGATIRYDHDWSEVTYFHFELDRHDIVLAEGAAAETYLDTGNRPVFDAECGVRPLRLAAPDADPLAATLHAYQNWGCAPLHLGGPAVATAHARLRRRAEDMGWRLTDDPSLSLTCDAYPTCAVAMTGAGEMSFRFPAEARHIRLRSRSFVPCEIDAENPDGRRLGVAVMRALLDDAPLPDAAFSAGFHAAEPHWRWTVGDAGLRLPRRSQPMRLHLRLMPTGPCYWLPPDCSVPPTAMAEQRREGLRSVLMNSPDPAASLMPPNGAVLGGSPRSRASMSVGQDTPTLAETRCRTRCSI